MVWAIVLCLCFPLNPLSGQSAEEEKELLCRQNLEVLGDAIFLYLRQHNGKLPGKLSALYEEGLVMDLGVFTCPASGNRIDDPARIDSLTDYILVPNDSGATKVLLLKEKDNFHSGNGHFFFSNWEIKKMPVNSAPGPAPEIPPAYLQNPRSKPAETPSSGDERPPAVPQSNPSQPSTKSASRIPTRSNPSGPLYSGGGSARPSAGPPALVFVFAFGILFLAAAIAAVLRSRRPHPSTVAVNPAADSVQAVKIDLRVRVSEPGKTVFTTVFLSAPVRIGRSGTNDLILEDPTVSREHALITAEDGKFYIVDLSRGDRTLLEDKPVKRAQIYARSRIILGTTELRIL